MKNIILISTFLVSYSIFGQQLVKSSIDSGGDLNTVGNLQIVYSIGETFIGEFQGSINASEGFINPVLLETLAAESNMFATEKIVLYPNPASNSITLQGLQTETIYIIYDVSGKVVLHGQFNQTNTMLNISHLQAGYYFIKLHKNRTIPFIKK